MTGRIELRRRIDRCVDELLELSGDDRLSRLAELGREDADLRARVEDLLRACDGTDGFLEEPLGVIAPDLVGAVGREEVDGADEDTDALAGATLGSYRIVRPIGRGGMASVYLGERTDGHPPRQVAVKVPSPATLGAAGERRFRAERTILAGLDHPGVVRWLDGGQSADGLPYLVMEHVDGEPIDVHCDRRRLPVEDRLRLLLKLCSAVAHVHSSRVVHLDLKPSNILVTPQGDIRLLDFGIAEMLDPEEEAAAPRLRPATPAYAAPEQFDGGPLSAATDIFALGLLLQKLVTGSSPSDGEAARPSAEERTGAPTRREPPGLPGGIGRVVRRAVRRAPEERHPSVARFAGDIHRHLAIPAGGTRPNRSDCGVQIAVPTGARRAPPERHVIRERGRQP